LVALVGLFMSMLNQPERTYGDANRKSATTNAQSGRVDLSKGQH
jgi:hypothetical protein